MLFIKSYLTLYKAFIRPHLDYADAIYDKPNNINICNEIENLQYHAALLLGQLEGHKRNNCTKNWALNIYVQEYG